MEMSRYWPKDLLFNENALDMILGDYQYLYGLKVEHAEDLKKFLEPLRIKSRDHWEHSLRVGYLASRIGHFMHLDNKALLFAGLVHDVGKALVAASTLNKTSDWKPEDSKAMEAHVNDGFRFLRDRFDFSAEIIAWHHRFQPNCYPLEAPMLLHKHDVGTSVLIPFYGRLLALADNFDALHRHNSRGVLTAKEIRTAMEKSAPDLKRLIKDLYDHGIFTNYEDVLRVEREGW